MTQNQISYWNLVETRRANQARESETSRSNRANESIQRNVLNETKRSNLARETETNRANQAKERENMRSNIAKETHNANELYQQVWVDAQKYRLEDEKLKHERDKLRETIRHNTVSEYYTQRGQDHQTLSNVFGQALGIISNVAKASMAG